MVWISKPWPQSLIESIVDGPGLRLVLFFSGCPHHCFSCHNPQTWKKENGILLKEELIVEEIFRKYNPDLHKGITFSGGDPLFQPESVLLISKIIKEKDTNINIWCYTGYKFEEINPNHISYCNVLVDGPYIEELKDESLIFRGSSNQKIIML